MGHVRFGPNFGSDPAYRQGRASVAHAAVRCSRGEYRRIKRRWQAALGRLKGNKTRGGFLGAPPSGATCTLDGRCFGRNRAAAMITLICADSRVQF
jgi:hypothetical protein